MLDALILMLRNVILFVALAVPGFLLVKCKILKTEHTNPLSALLMYVGMPFLVVSSTAKVDLTVDKLVGIGAIALLTIVFVFSTFFLSKPLTLMEKEKKKKGVMQFCILFCNNVFFGIPLARAVFGEGSTEVIFLIVIGIITNIFMYTLGVYMISGDKRTISVKKVLLSPVLIAFVLGLGLNLLDKWVKFSSYIPEIHTYTGYFGNIVTPLSMTILGMKLGGVQFKKLFASWKMFYVSAFKLIIIPAIFIGCMLLLRLFIPNVVSVEMIFAAFVGFGMPTASLSTTFSDLYDGDVENAVSYTLGSTILSIVTIPVLYWLLCMIL